MTLSGLLFVELVSIFQNIYAKLALTGVTVSVLVVLSGSFTF